MLKVILLIIYFAVLVGIGLYCRKHATDVDGFVLGGRSVGPWLTAFAYGTSYFSAVVFVGYAGQFGWKYGIAATWAGIGNAIIGSLMAWAVLGRRTRIMSQHLDSATMPQFFGERFHLVYIFLSLFTDLNIAVARFRSYRRYSERKQCVMFLDKFKAPYYARLEFPLAGDQMVARRHYHRCLRIACFDMIGRPCYARCCIAASRLQQDTVVRQIGQLLLHQRCIGFVGDNYYIFLRHYRQHTVIAHLQQRPARA